MASISATAGALQAHAVPHDRAQVRTWARHQLKGGLDAFVAIARDPNASLSATTALTLDVFSTAAALLARAKPAETADWLASRLGDFDSDLTQDRIGDATADNFAWVLEPLIIEAARTLQMQPLTAQEPYLSAGLNRALCSYLTLDPDLHRVPLRQLCQAIHDGISAADPQETVEVLSDLHDLIRPAVAAAQSPSDLAAIISPPTEIPADFEVEIEVDVAFPTSDIEATITRLQARRMALAPISARDELHGTWIVERLDELEGQRRFFEAMNSSIRHKRDKKPLKP